MQSGYGVPETQQFMLEGCSSSSLLSISQSISNSSQSKHQQHVQYNHLHQLQQPQQQRHLHIQHQIPITQTFFQQHPYPHFQTFLQQQQQGQLHQESSPDNSQPSRIVGGTGHFVATNFKFGVDDSSNLNDYNQVIQGRREEGCVEEQREEDSAVKEPFWKPLDIDYINRNNKRCKERMETSYEFCKKGEKGVEMEEGKSSGSNYGLFGELEAIYTVGGAGINGGHNQTGSGSVLSGDNPAATPAVPGTVPDSGGADHVSETSAGEEASLKFQKSKRKKRKKQLGTIAAFFERLVKQLMEHQESLHRKFLEVMEKRDQERMTREETWRQQEAAKSKREAMARAEDYALASSREAAIVEFLEKITGEKINLPTKGQFERSSQLQEESQGDDDKAIEVTDMSNENNNNTNNNADNLNTTNISKRWPKTEVQALIRVRSSLESKFQEPGLKGPLWEQVSTAMASLGYQRSAKRCKEKWENINKYFRKTKDSAKKRSQQSKTCPYFHQLDQLYSRSHTPSPHNPPSLAPSASINVEPKEHSELLDAIVVPPELGISQNPRVEFGQEPIGVRRNFNCSHMGPLGLDFNRSGSGDNSRRQEAVLNEEDDEEEDDDDDDEDDEDVEGGGGENAQRVGIQGIQREQRD